MLSKTVFAGTLPFALLLVLWFGQQGRLEARRDLMPVVPLIVLGIAAGS
jgi:hypothetical protein